MHFLEFQSSVSQTENKFSLLHTILQETKIQDRPMFTGNEEI